MLLRHFLLEASRELKVETKALKPEVEALLGTLAWPGNVRQLENTCRWITVMAAGKDVHLDDLPPELFKPPREVGGQESAGLDWQEALKDWVDQELKLGRVNIAKEAIESAEGILITRALGATRGRRQEAAKLLGYGRNTLTRKITELELDV